MTDTKQTIGDRMERLTPLIEFITSVGFVDVDYKELIDRDLVVVRFLDGFANQEYHIGFTLPLDTGQVREALERFKSDLRKGFYERAGRYGK